MRLVPPCKQVLMEQIKMSWYILKLYKNVVVVDPLAKYTLLDYRFELIDSYVLVKWFDGEQVPQGTEGDENTVMEHSHNEYDGEEDIVTDVKLSQDKDSNGDDDMDDQDG